MTQKINLGANLSIMETPTEPLTPTLARARTGSLAPQPPPSPGTPGTAGTPIARPARSGKARDLLRQHYGMNIGPPVPLPGRPNDPMDIGLSLVPSLQHTYSQRPILIEQTPHHSMPRHIMSNLLPLPR